MAKITNSKILITGGAGFIGSNLVDLFLAQNNEVVCLDNFATGKKENLNNALKHPNFRLINGDIRNSNDCQNAVKGCSYVLHQAALGSVPRSINDPATTNAVNIDGFLNMLIASRNEGVERFVYASSSSAYGSSKELPKVENNIGTPLSPYAVTKYVNELYADVFAKTYGMTCIGLRYFNVFGRRQDPDGAYAAVIPLWVKQLLKHERPTINGDGSYSRDFTYIDNVLQANENALTSKLENTNGYFAEVFNIAYGGNTTLLQLFTALRENLALFDAKIKTIEPLFGDFRKGDIPHSQASIEKAKKYLHYTPHFTAEDGLLQACEWYYNNIG